MIADYGLTETALRDDPTAVSLRLWVLLEDADVLEDTEVFFLVETAGGETLRTEPTEVRESLEGVTCSAVLEVPEAELTASVGFRKNGWERLQALGQYGQMPQQ